MGESLIERVRHAAAVAKIELDYNVIENPLNPIFDKKTQKTGTCNAARDGFRQQLAANIYDPVLGPNFEKSEESPYNAAETYVCLPSLYNQNLFQLFRPSSDFPPDVSRSFLSLSLLSPFSPLSSLLSLSSRDPNPTCCVLAAQLKPTRFLWLKFAATLKQFYQDKCLSQLSWKSLKIFVWRCAESDLRASRASKSREATNASKSIKRRKRSLLCGVDVCV
jgi:hypothetical protein